MRVFVTVADEQGFAAAARKLKLSSPAVTRAVSALEARLGVKLLTRTTRHVRVTDAGQRYLEDARRILHELELANESALGINAEPRGRLSITASVLFGQKFVLPSITRYLSRFPETQINAVFVDRVVNLMDEGFDLGVRIGHLSDSGMNAKRLGHVQVHWLASPAYLSKNGVPGSPTDLDNHTTIATSSSSMTLDWQFMQKNQSHTVRLHPRLTVSTNQAAIEAAKQGFGIIRMLSYQVTEELEQQQLKVVLGAYEPPPLPVHIIHREGHHASAKTRAFIDILSDDLQNTKALS